jgi:hypothetical protein
MAPSAVLQTREGAHLRAFLEVNRKEKSSIVWFATHRL